MKANCACMNKDDEDDEEEEGQEAEQDELIFEVTENLILGIRKNLTSGQSVKNSNRFYNYCTVITNAEQKLSKQVESILKVLFIILNVCFVESKLKVLFHRLKWMFR